MKNTIRLISGIILVLLSLATVMKPVEGIGLVLLQVMVMGVLLFFGMYMISKAERIHRLKNIDHEDNQDS